MRKLVDTLTVGLKLKLYVCISNVDMTDPPPLPSNDESQLMENGGNQSFLSKAIHKMV